MTAVPIEEPVVLSCFRPTNPSQRVPSMRRCPFQSVLLTPRHVRLKALDTPRAASTSRQAPIAYLIRQPRFCERSEDRRHRSLKSLCRSTRDKFQGIMGRGHRALVTCARPLLRNIHFIIIASSNVIMQSAIVAQRANTVLVHNASSARPCAARLTRYGRRATTSCFVGVYRVI